MFYSTDGANLERSSDELSFSARELRVSAPMPDPVQSQPAASEAEQLSRLLELELIQNRTAWEQARRRKKSLRSFAILFVFFLFVGCLLGFFFVFNRVNEERQSRPAATANR